MSLRNTEKYFWDIIFSLGIVFTTMTSLRTSNLPIGIGEVLLLLWMVKQLFTLYNNRERLPKNLSYVIFLGILFFTILLLGAVVSIINIRINISSMVHDLIAYSFSYFILIFLYLKSHQNSLESIMKTLLIIGVSIFGFLLMWSRIKGNHFMGMNLMYGLNRFTGGAKNPNQLGIFIAPLPFLALYFIKNERSKSYVKKIILILCFIVSINIGLNINSDAINGTWLIMLMVSGFIIAYSKFKSHSKIILLLVSIIVVITILYLYGNIINKNIIKYFNELDHDGSRGDLWVQGIKKYLESPIVGFGPGGHLVLGTNQNGEAHNSFIDLLTQGGTFIFLLYNYIIIKIFKNIKVKPYLNLVFITLLVFSISHFTLRHPVYWVYFTFLLTYENTNNPKNIDVLHLNK